MQYTYNLAVLDPSFFNLAEKSGFNPGMTSAESRKLTALGLYP
ncbi:hypothetical protein RintRC_2305 [Richelia intracellularis]|nr:hypothetical protein RintRC_2305 [Richelia intracellularis]